MMSDLAKKYFDDLDQEALTQLPIAACSFFVPPSADGKFYTLVKDDTKLKQILETKLEEYNENYAKMDLILFEMAIDHVCRISRILDIPRGNALLVGVGGSGKQSLARLASFLGDYEVFQITVSKTYGPADFKLDLLNLYKMTGLKNKGMVFLLTDTQIVDETFLVYINDILSTGIIPDLFPEDEYEGVISAMRNEVKQAGILDSRENCWEFFIEKVRKNLHLALCFSPVGDLFRVRARQFPALCSCTVIDWFHPWPLDALQSVAYRFLLELELGSDELTRNVANHMAFCHQNVNDMSKRYLEQERRYNYTTPKSFLELIALYKHMLGEKRVESRSLQDRFENGLDKLRSTGRDVAELQESLKRDQVLVEEKKKATDDLLVMVGKDQAVAEQQKSIADVQEKEMQVIFAEVTEFQTKCEAELAEAEPAILAAEEALNTLDKKSLTELKSFTKPADEIIEVTSAVLILTSPEGKLEKDLSWASAKKMMASVDKFLGSLISFDKEAIPDANMKAVEKYVTNPSFKGDAIRSKSSAAAGLCEWVRNIVIYYKIFLKVNPMRERLQEANDKLEKSTASLNVIKSKVADLDSKLKKLMDDFEKATEEKNRVIQEAERTKARLELAERLVGGLADENERWGLELKNLQEKEGYLVGDVLLSSAFVSYIGAFNYQFRAEMINDMWVPDLLKREIPLSDGFDVLQLLTNSSTIA
jgi:dynein heavy chain